MEISYLIAEGEIILTFWAVVWWLSILHNFTFQSLNPGFAQIQILLVSCQIFPMVRISDNDPAGNKAKFTSVAFKCKQREKELLTLLVENNVLNVR